MFTKKTLAGLKFSYSISRKLNYLPFEYDPVLDTFRKVSTPRLLLSYLSFIWLLLYTTNMWFGLVAGLSKNEPGRTALDLLFSLAFTGSCLYVYSSFCKRTEFIKFASELLAFDRKQTQRMYHSTHPVRKDGCTEILWILNFGNIYFPIVCLVPFLIDPLNPRYSYHWLPEGWRSPVSFFIFSLLETYSFFVMLAAFYVQVIIAVLHSKCTNFWLKILLEKRNTNTGRKTFKRVPRRRHELFGTIRMLNILADGALQDIVWPILIISSITFISYGIYGAVKLYGHVPFQVYCLFPSISVSMPGTTLTLFHIVGSMHALSREYVQRCTLLARSKYEVKILKALRPVGASVRSVFLIKRTTVLLVVLVVSNVTINAILLHE